VPGTPWLSSSCLEAHFDARRSTFTSSIISSIDLAPPMKPYRLLTTGSNSISEKLKGPLAAGKSFMTAIRVAKQNVEPLEESTIRARKHSKIMKSTT